MNRQLAKLTTQLVFILILALGALGSAQATVDDLHGKLWRDLPGTTNLTWGQVAAVCPQDGVTPCTGSIGGLNLTDWVWATDAQTIELFSYFAPEIIETGGTNNFFAAETFLSTFEPTFSFCITYACGAYADGWTATLNETGLPMVGSVGWDTTPVSISGGLGVGPAASIDEFNVYRGIWLWRATGGNDGTVHAYRDSGASPGPFGGTAIANVLANDWVAGQPATTANVTLTQLTVPAGITLLTNGSVTVAAGVPYGTYSFSYRICAIAAPGNCDDAEVTISVGPFTLLASSEVVTVSNTGIVIANVLANDTLGGYIVNTSVVTLQQVSSSSTEISLNSATGAVSLAAGAAYTTHTLTYEICEVANLTNCKQATAVVTRIPYSIYAVNDVFPKISSKTGGVSTSVLANDSFNGAVPTTATVSVVLLNTPIRGITFSTTTGKFTVQKKTRSGTYTYSYQICEIANPTNCASATATLDLSGGV